MKITAKNITDIVKELRFELSQNVQNDFAHFFDEHLKALAALQAIDTTNILPMTHVDNAPLTNALRPDVAKAALDQASVLSNAAQSANDYIVIARESNDD